MSEEQFRARVGRRGFLRGAGVGAAGIAAAALIGCGDSDDDEPAAASSSSGSSGSSGSSSSSSSSSSASSSGPTKGGTLQAGPTAEINPTTGYPYVFLAENP